MTVVSTKIFAVTGATMLFVFAGGDCVAAAPFSDQQQLIERMKIDELLVRSGRAFDKHDVDGWIATFTPDGEWDTQYVMCKGPEALRAYLTKGFNCIGVQGGSAVPGAPPPPFGGRNPEQAAAPAGDNAARTGAAARPGSSVTQHFISSPTYQFIDERTVRYTAYWMTVAGGGEMVGGRIVSVGSYDDTLVKINGNWLIKQRQIKH